MTKQETEVSPGVLWLSLPLDAQVVFLEGLIQGLNQGLRHCATEMAFALATRLPNSLTPENKLAVDYLIQQTRTWSKSDVSIFKFSKPVDTYARLLANFYTNYPKYHHLSPAYLMIYMDDKHGMSPQELYSLHEHSLHGFKR
ncbi:MAG: hypothetical protein HY711_02455 [Candidatus Melainabacteria bacterium]|nr:hypothetical protein [Candidatus Melainabacteria bacterium]